MVEVILPSRSCIKQFAQGKIAGDCCHFGHFSEFPHFGAPGPLESVRSAAECIGQCKCVQVRRIWRRRQRDIVVVVALLFRLILVGVGDEARILEAG